MRKILGTYKKIALAGAVLILLLGCTPKGDDGKKVIILRMNSQAVSFDTDGNRLHQTFMDEVSKNSNGRIKVEPHFSSSLGGTPEAAIGGIQNKSYEMITFALGIYAMYTNAFLPMDVPYLIDSDEMAYAVISGDLGKKMAEKCEADTGIKMLYYNMLGFRLLSNSKHPITAPDDLKGLKIRTQANPFHMAAMEIHGASVTTTPFSELFTALQQKVIDGQENPIMNVRDSRFNEIQQYLTKTNHLYTFAGAGINAEFYNGLSQELRDVIGKAAATAQAQTLRELKDAEIAAYKQIGSATEIVELSGTQMAAFKEKTVPLLSRFKDQQKSDYFSQVVDEIQKLAD
ncbi:MAG: TRAP transporter substrate-binding protein [Treponema sp.]|jgi:tripartite ATP-independent transporter DctP family solute receptor|nr:TRAP transporter substrate-binding protein [Treponema sp.]